MNMLELLYLLKYLKQYKQFPLTLEDIAFSLSVTNYRAYVISTRKQETHFKAPSYTRNTF